MEQIIEILTPWAKPFLVFCGFMLIRYLYRTVILRFLQLLNNKMSFEYGGDILDAFAKPIHIFLFILGVYAALNYSPITFVTIRQLINSCAAALLLPSFGAFIISATLRTALR